MASVVELRDSGLTWEQVAQAAGLGSETAARRAFKAEMKEAAFEAVAPVDNVFYESNYRIVGPKPLAVPVPLDEINVDPDSDVIRAMLYGDTHIPFQDNKALDVVEQVGKLFDPHVITHMGDLMDFYHLSAFDKNPARFHTVQTEIDAARIHLAHLRLAFPEAVIYYLEGNHEERLTRAMWNTEGTARALMQLVNVQKALTIPGLLGLDELGVNWVPVHEQSRADILPKMILKHGDIVRKWSGFTAKGEWEKYGRSGASGHTHRLGVFFHGKHGGGAHMWAETGCTCILNPEYAIDPDWQHGLVLMTIEKSTGAFEIEPIYIRDGHAVYRGNVIDARV